MAAPLAAVTAQATRVLSPGDVFTGPPAEVARLTALGHLED